MNKEKLPWTIYNEHFKIIKMIDDHLTYLKWFIMWSSNKTDAKPFTSGSISRYRYP